MMVPLSQVPFAPEHQLSWCDHESSAQHQIPPSLPNKPLSQTSIHALLIREFCSDDLDRVAPRLWWMSKQDSGNISPLHRQHVKRRQIVITEDPRLHLVWINDRIFIKPLPRYLTSYAFWKSHLCGDDEQTERIRGEVLGYLRTYRYLIQYESDFRIAQDARLCLVPKEVTWEQFCAFTSRFGTDIMDRNVSLRYAYGEVRLTRLNFYAPFLLRRSYFQRVDYQYGEYFSRFFTPVVFVFAVVAVILGGLQVIVSMGDNTSSPSTQLALSISVAAISGSISLLFALGVLFVYKVAMEWRYALRDRYRQRQKESV